MSKNKRRNDADIAEYMYTEYVNNADLISIQKISENLSLLKDNGLAVRIRGREAMYQTQRMSRYKVISLFLQKYDKKLKNQLRRLTRQEEELELQRTTKDTKGLNDILKLNKSGLDFSTYYVLLEDKKSPEFAIFEVTPANDYEDYTIDYCLYLVGEKCDSYKNKLFKMFEKYDKYYKEKDKDRNYIYDTNTDEEKEVTFKSFDQMVFTGKEDVVNYIDRWVNNIPKYYKYGMTPKLSILLYGKPGTGKSTFYKALAKYLKVQTVKTIDTTYFFMTEDQKHGNRRRRRCDDDGSDSFIIAIDEIDCIAKSRTDKSDDKDNDKTLSKLLAFLDNPDTFYYKAKDGTYYPVSIVVATTNYIDKLDEAVKRYGRFDLQIEMKDFNRDEAERFCNLYDLTLRDVVDNVGGDFEISPAKLQALCMDNIDRSMKS